MVERTLTIRLSSWLVLSFLAAILLVGCYSPPSPAPFQSSVLSQAERDNAAGTLKLAMRRHNWEKAWNAAEILLDERSLDHSTGLGSEEASKSNSMPPISARNWSLMAQVAHETNRLSTAANFLTRACHAERYENPQRVQQTMVAMIEAGMLFDGTDFLALALKENPGSDQIRRLLFDLYMGAENRVAAMPLGMELVLARQFDTNLLLALANTERRTDDPEPLEQVVQRNPKDRRPLIGVARVSFDTSKFDEAIKLLVEIIETHPDFFPAQALLGQAYAASGQFDEIRSWADQQNDGIQYYPGYWIALGDWAIERGNIRQAHTVFSRSHSDERP